MTAITMVSPQHASTKPCTSASCCSPSRLWRTIQSIINGDQREEFRKLMGDQTKLPHLVRVLLTSRLSNNPLVYSRPSTHIDRRLLEKFGKLTPTDLNALEIALLKRHDQIAYSILLVLKRNVTPAELIQFLNHQWGKEKLTALHLASFWGMSKLVRLMLELGADPLSLSIRQLSPIDCTTHSDIISMLQQQQPPLVSSTTTTPSVSPPPPPPTPMISKRPSLLLRKAEKSFIRTSSPVYYDIDRTPVMSPLSFSSSSSSSSSLSSFDYHWTPPNSPLPSSDILSPLVQQLKLTHPAATAAAAAAAAATTTLPPPPPPPQDDNNNQVVAVMIERPGCFPRHSSSHNIIMNDNKQHIVSQKPKKVHFDPQAILMDACTRGYKDELTDYLENNSVDCNQIKDLQNRSLLHISLLYGHLDIFEYLHDKVDINLADQDGWTCLHYAAALGLWRSLQFLTSLPHCNVNARTNHGLKVEDCPESDFGKRKCKIIMDKTLSQNNVKYITK
ncbi:ankyrin repeat-containing domain protein [Pilaira anomala]|nr:ankyrin repeat-containing domain protein [Pilaira anomala]